MLPHWVNLVCASCWSLFEPAFEIVAFAWDCFESCCLIENNLTIVILHTNPKIIIRTKTSKGERRKSLLKTSETVEYSPNYKPKTSI